MVTSNLGVSLFLDILIFLRKPRNNSCPLLDTMEGRQNGPTGLKQTQLYLDLSSQVTCNGVTGNVVRITQGQSGQTIFISELLIFGETGSKTKYQVGY